MTSWKGSTMRKSSYDAHTPYDSNHALAGVLKGTQTYWSRGAATLRYFHEPVPAWSCQTPDVDCGWTHDPQDACLVARTSLWGVVGDRKSVVTGTRELVRVDLGGRLRFTKKRQRQ